MKHGFIVVCTAILWLAVTAPAPADTPPSQEPDTSPTPAPGPIEPFDWSGFYLGVHGGYDWAFPHITVANTPSPRFGGFLGGAQAGFNLQSGPFVYGIEGEFSATNARSTLYTSGTVTHGLPDKYADISARLGYGQDNWLFFVKSGGAWMEEGFEVQHSSGSTCTYPTCTGTNTTYGWAAGGGVEYGLSERWSLNLEYTYLDFPRVEHPVVSNGVSQQVLSVKRTFDQVAVGANYRF